MSAHIDYAIHYIQSRGKESWYSTTMHVVIIGTRLPIISLSPSTTFPIMIQHSRLLCGIWLNYIMALKWYKYPTYPQTYACFQMLDYVYTHTVTIHVFSSPTKATTTALWWHRIYKCSPALVNEIPERRLHTQHRCRFQIQAIYNPTWRSLHISSKWRRVEMVNVGFS